jgi:hypothetical protein
MWHATCMHVNQGDFWVLVVKNGIDIVVTPLWGKCEVAIHTFENGTWESSGTPENSEFNSRGQNNSPWGFLYIVGKVLKCRCPKWPCMSHLDICSTSYGRKKGRESNWHFDSRPLKVKNRPDPGVCRQSVAHRWKALKESYKFALDLISIGGLNKKLLAAKVLRVKIEIKSHLDVAPVEWRKIYYMGEGDGFPRVRAVVSQVSGELLVACPSTKGAPECELTNLLVGLMQVRVSE